MLIIYGNLVINMNTVHSFWKSDTMDGCDVKRFYIKFSDSCSKIQDIDLNFLPFDTEELRDKAFKDILFAYAEDLKVFAIVTNPQEEKK